MTYVDNIGTVHRLSEGEIHRLAKHMAGNEAQYISETTTRNWQLASLIAEVITLRRYLREIGREQQADIRIQEALIYIDDDGSKPR